MSFVPKLFRHGDRSPTAFYPTYPNNHRSDWPAGLGELTNTGKRQLFQLGQWLRQRYNEDFLPKRYSENNIYVRSTDVDRTIVSAMCNLAGLYPPTGDQVWNNKIPWQPIPVHTVPASDDWVLGASLPSCPIYDKAFANVFASPDVQTVINQYQSQIKNALRKAGLSLNLSSWDSLQDVLLLGDTLFIEKLYNKR